MDHIQNITEKVPNLVSSLVPLLQGTFPVSFLLSFLGMGSDEVKRITDVAWEKVNAAHSASIDNVILTLAACILIAAFAYRIATFAHRFLFSKIPFFILMGPIAISTLWSLFLGTFWFQVALSLALLVGGGKFSPSFWTVHCLLAMGLVQAVIWMAPPQDLAVKTFGQPAPAALTPNSVSSYASAEEFYLQPQTETIVLYSNHAHGQWQLPSILSKKGKYRHLVSYFEDTTITVAAKLHAAWIFGANTQLKHAHIVASAAGNVKLCSLGNKNALEPILVFPFSMKLENVTVDCSAFSKKKNSPCIVVSDAPSAFSAPTPRLFSGLTILFNQSTITTSEAHSLGLMGFVSTDTTPSNRAMEELYSCVVSRHEPAWHGLVRRWPLTALVAKQSFDVAISVGGSVVEKVGIPAAIAIGHALTEMGSVTVAAFCGLMSGAGVMPLPFCPPMTADTKEKYYSNQSLADVILSPDLHYDTFKRAALQQIYEASQAITSIVMWTGLPMLVGLVRWSIEFDWKWTVFMFEWTIMPFVNLGGAILEGVASVAMILFSDSGQSDADGNVTARNGIAGTVAAFLQWVSHCCWTFFEKTLWPLIATVGLSLLRSVTYCLNLYADTGFNVQIFMALLQTLVVVYNLHLQCMASASGRWSWASYPYAMSRIAMRNYRSIAVYGLTHLVGGLLVLGTSFMPFSGALGLHFLTLNIVFPFGSCYALLHFMGHDRNKKAMTIAVVTRILLSIIIQKGVGDLVSRIVTELLRLLLLAALVVIAAVYWGWRGPAPPTAGNNNGRPNGDSNEGGGGGGRNPSNSPGRGSASKTRTSPAKSEGKKASSPSKTNSNANSRAKTPSPPPNNDNDAALTPPPVASTPTAS